MSVQPKQKTPKLDPQLVNQLLSGRKTAGEIEDLLKDLRKAFIESALDGELTQLLGYEKHDASGRNSGFEPQLIAKHQRRWDGFDETILALYARGMSTRDVQSFLREKYDIDVSPEFI